MAENRENIFLSRFDLKYFRNNADVTQVQLAKELSVSQAQISKWEKEKRVPDDLRASLRKIFGLTYKHLDDIEMCGGEDKAKDWLRYMDYFVSNIMDSEAGDSTMLDDYREMGVNCIFGPLVEAGFKLPDPPTINNVDDDGDEPSVTYPNDADELFFGEKGALNQFFIAYRYLNNAILYLDEEIDYEDYLDLDGRSAEYIWVRLLGQFKIDTTPLIDCEELQHLFKGMDRDRLNKAAADFRTRVAEAWHKAYWSKESACEKPTWLPLNLIDNVPIDDDDVTDLTPSVVFDSRWMVNMNISPDPFIRELQDRLREMEHRNDLLHKKVDNLMKHFELEVPMHTEDEWAEMQKVVNAIEK